MLNKTKTDIKETLMEEIGLLNCNYNLFQNWTSYKRKVGKIEQA